MKFLIKRFLKRTIYPLFKRAVLNILRTDEADMIIKSKIPPPAILSTPIEDQIVKLQSFEILKARQNDKNTL
jgi:hypothetical protein